MHGSHPTPWASQPTCKSDKAIPSLSLTWQNRLGMGSGSSRRAAPTITTRQSTQHNLEAADFMWYKKCRCFGTTGRYNA
eukprot:364589-Chlamydomonas_euryale.AAC.3